MNLDYSQLSEAQIQEQLAILNRQLEVYQSALATGNHMKADLGAEQQRRRLAAWFDVHPKLVRLAIGDKLLAVKSYETISRIHEGAILEIKEIAFEKIPTYLPESHWGESIVRVIGDFKGRNYDLFITVHTAGHYRRAYLDAAESGAANG